MKLAIVISFLMGCGFCTSHEVDDRPPRVVTRLGSVEGYWKTSYGGRKYKGFEGIPYAQPPIGELRFRVPRPALPWNGVLMAKQLGSTCLQYSRVLTFGEPPGIVSGDEDCLTLNVYTPITDHSESCRKSWNGKSNELLPVIVYVHGGAYQFGYGGQYGPKYLLDNDIIYVNFNYRLGPLGFLSTEDDIVPGNMGLKDQVMALRWVTKNIRCFGGDPSRVTIIGQSAGAGSVQYLQMSKLTTGLFHRAISISGSALNSWALQKNSREKAKKLAAIVGCPSDDVELMVDCLRLRPADQITNTTGEFMGYWYNPPVPFSPVVEKCADEFTFIDRSPIDILTSGPLPQDVPHIMSVVSEEGIYPMSAFLNHDVLLEDLNDSWETVAPYMLDYNYTIPERDHAEVARLIKQHYLGSRPIDRTTSERMIQMLGDRWWVTDTEKSARIQAQSNESPVQFYYFSYRGAHSLSEELTGSTENFGVCHVDDLFYVLDGDFDPTTTENDRRIQKLLIGIWISFATHGKADVGVEWTRVSRSSEDDFRYLHIASPDDISMDTISDFGERIFWGTVPLHENIINSKNFYRSV